MLLGLQSERVNVDTLVGGDVLVVLEGLHQVEVLTSALGKTVVTVELQLGGGGHVGATRSIGGPSVGSNDGGDANPDQLLHGVVARTPIVSYGRGSYLKSTEVS